MNYIIASKEADKQIMDQLIQLLEEAGFYVYSDRKKLKDGDCWRNKIYSAICSCHAAVVLVTQEALDNAKYPWVFKECSMFTMLKYANSQFPIIPITMTGVTIEDIDKSSFKALQLNEIMAGSYEDLKTVMDIIKSKLGEPECSDGPLYYLHNLIANISILSDKTEDDYLDFLCAISGDLSLLPPRIQEAFTDTSLLFLGHRIADWDFRVFSGFLLNT